MMLMVDLRGLVEVILGFQDAGDMLRWCSGSYWSFHDAGGCFTGSSGSY